MHNRVTWLTGFALGCCFVASAALAAAPMTSKDFVKHAAAAGLAEVELGQLAVQKSTNDEVKRFGQEMVDDHSKANDQLKSAAQQHNIPLPDAPLPEQKAAAAKLSKKSGAAFDRAFADQMVRDHRKVVSMFRAAAHDKKLEPELQQFAQSTLPTLEHHLQQAEQLKSQVSNGSRRASR